MEDIAYVLGNLTMAATANQGNIDQFMGEITPVGRKKKIEQIK